MFEWLPFLLCVGETPISVLAQKPENLTEIFVVVLSEIRQMPEQYIKTGQGHLLQNLLITQ
jgi:hypothetical protein